MLRRTTTLVFLSLLTVCLAPWRLDAADKPLVHPLFADHMVLQRDLTVPVWGWTEPGREIRVSLAGMTAAARADETGRWQVKLGPFSAGGPHTMRIEGPQTIVIQDVLIGDVWICSGQSNMEWGMWGVNNSPQEIAAADHPQLRLFTVPKKIATRPEEVPGGQWQVCSPQTVAGFSAVGYFFGRDLQQAIIDGDTVVVSSPDVAAPVAVRYGWANNPVCNLYNQAGLPASPFRTDVEGP